VFAAYPACTHFAFRREGATFLGATPETLFRKRGVDLKTEALAGTTRIKDDPNFESSRDVAALQSSQKDLGEHALVVQRICQELEPLSTDLRYSSTPTTRQVRNLIHLQTPIAATLRESTSVFDLLAALHPTPAVGGFPAREAAEWIRMNEPLERGWYTGTLGWIDAAGDGEFAVAIRCGVLTDKRAYIFAGAGIVSASDAAAEYAETAAKMWPVLRALGVMI
jgi:isochorismate synthase